MHAVRLYLVSLKYTYMHVHLYNIYFVLFVGTNPSLTAAVVVVTGLVGANFVQATLDKLQFRDPIARGIATASRYASLLNPLHETVNYK